MVLQPETKDNSGMARFKKKKILDLELGTQDLITVPPRIHGMRLVSDFNSPNLGFHI